MNWDPNKTCKNCLYFCLKKTQPNDDQTQGSCTAETPKIVDFRFNRWDPMSGIFPIVVESLHCGKWQPAYKPEEQ